MTVKITQLEGNQFRAESDGYEVISGRLDEQTPPIGMSPGKLMVASLGLCSAFHAAWYLKRQKIEATSLQIDVDDMNEKEPSRASGFNITVKVGAKLDARQLEGLLAEMKRCYVANTMRGLPRFSYEIKSH
ncbi:MAG: OsmC family protein [Candidatus Bathyarchaeia archaeon]|jgi:uncharacterized OsmC-like protein